MNPVIVNQGKSPVVLAMPHGGQQIPAAIAARLNDLGRRIDDTDWWIDRLYDDLLDDPTVVKATFSRYVADANRAPDNESLYPGQNTTGICSPLSFDGKPIYRAGQEPDSAEIETRIKQFHEPYHQALRAQIERIKALHGVAVVYDCHSIRSHIPYLFEGELPVFNIGTNGGATCNPKIEACVVEVCKGAEDYSFALNGRFKGGWTTRHYGQPDQGVHVIQMELAQRAYMEEKPPWSYRTDRAEQIRPYLKALLLKIEALALGGQLR